MGIFASHYTRCRCGDLTMGDIEREIAHFRTIIDKWLATTNPLYAKLSVFMKQNINWT